MKTAIFNVLLVFAALLVYWAVDTYRKWTA